MTKDMKKYRDASYIYRMMFLPLTVIAIQQMAPADNAVCRYKCRARYEQFATHAYLDNYLGQGNN
jgi:hypothetical protein